LGTPVADCRTVILVYLCICATVSEIYNDVENQALGPTI